MNPNGGGISLGHPLGATGARITATLVSELERRNARYGIAAHVHRLRPGHRRRRRAPVTIAVPGTAARCLAPSKRVSGFACVEPIRGHGRGDSRHDDAGARGASDPGRVGRRRGRAARLVRRRHRARDVDRAGGRRRRLGRREAQLRRRHVLHDAIRIDDAARHGRLSGAAPRQDLPGPARPGTLATSSSATASSQGSRAASSRPRSSRPTSARRCSAASAFSCRSSKASAMPGSSSPARSPSTTSRRRTVAARASRPRRRDRRQSVDYELTTVPGIKNKVFGGDGLFLLRLTGPGKVWLQSLSLPMLAHALAPYLPHEHAADAGRRALQTIGICRGCAGDRQASLASLAGCRRDDFGSARRARRHLRRPRRARRHLGRAPPGAEAPARPRQRPARRSSSSRSR